MYLTPSHLCLGYTWIRIPISPLFGTFLADICMVLGRVLADFCRVEICNLSIFRIFFFSFSSKFWFSEKNWSTFVSSVLFKKVKKARRHGTFEEVFWGCGQLSRGLQRRVGCGEHRQRGDSGFGGLTTKKVKRVCVSEDVDYVLDLLILLLKN